MPPRSLSLVFFALLLGVPGAMPSASPQMLVAGWQATPVLVEAAQLEPGVNSITERQARSRLAALRFNSVRNLRKDENGFWRGLAWHAGQEVEVAMDVRGHIATGPGVASRDRATPRRDD